MQYLRKILQWAWPLYVVVANMFFLHSSLVLKQHWGQKRPEKLGQKKTNAKWCKCQQELIKANPELYVLHRNVMQSGVSSIDSRWHQNKSSMQKKTSDVDPSIFLQVVKYANVL